MLPKLLTSIFGSRNDRLLKQYRQVVAQINALEPKFEALDDASLIAKTDEFRQRFKKGESLDNLLPEAFATAREGGKRVLKMRHFDVQMIGGMTMHYGKIAEMRTGEGKTLMATLPIYLNAITAQGVHLVTVNEYLVRRDAEWMGRLYTFLGLTVGINLPNMSRTEKQAAYAADVTYGTNNEFGFDYLRDNMVVSADQRVQRELVFAIVDEVDNILIDEARTPLIISGQAERSNDRYYQFAQIAKQLRPVRHFEVDLKHKSATLTEEGIDKVEELAGIDEGESIFDERYIELTHYLENALKAEATFHRDKDYIVRDGEIIIVDEFTGRQMPGRRWSEGLHQAVEAKEGLRVRRQNVTMATITFQNYFRMYEKLAGMTGTAKTEEEEFQRIYNLEVVTIPTNRDMVREDHADLVFKSEQNKFDAVIKDIEGNVVKGRPVLVGTTSIDTSERLSDALQRKGITHEVLNAKQHEREASIIEHAGQPGIVTIATNMAGRGTDIVLGPGVKEAGGLHIIGTERHEARRIDNQLRGRAGRQGDPGSSRFYVSLDDELMRRFGSERIVGLMEKLGMEDDVPIEHRVISKSIESAQTKVEGHNFDMRRHVVQYDDVMNKHREVIYEDRKEIVSGADISEKIETMISDEVATLITRFSGNERHDETDYTGIFETYTALIPNSHLKLPDIEGLDAAGLTEVLTEDAGVAYQEVEDRFGVDTMRTVERHILLAVIDRLWVEHLTAMDDLREGVGLQAYGQRDPLVVYKTEGYKMFIRLQENIQHDLVHTIFRVQPVVAEQPVRTRITEENLTTNRDDESHAPAKKQKKIGPNDRCYCGSGKKYKFCHGAPKRAVVA